MSEKPLNKIAKELAEESIELFGKKKATSKDPMVYHMLMVTEIAEAAEAYRTNQPAFYLDEKSGKPEGEAVELIDALIRILNYCGHRGWDVDAILKAKRDYNMTKRKWKKEGKKV
jgi:NTP pyrophosphatase (non-canonical NTP hydrolase)